MPRFVASFSAVEKEGGEQVSYCVWGEGPDTLLPEAEMVVGVDPTVVSPGAISIRRPGQRDEAGAPSRAR